MPEPSQDAASSDALPGAAVCANCGRARDTPYCAHCGQNDRDYSRALRPVAGELLRETFQLDSRLFRTLKLLLLKPGGLTREFSRNRRARYVSPVRLYLFASFLFFPLLSMTDFGQPVLAPAPQADGEGPGVELSEPGTPDADRRTETVRGTVRVRQRALDVPEDRIDAFKAVLPAGHSAKIDDILDRDGDDPVRAGVLVAIGRMDPAEIGPQPGDPYLWRQVQRAMNFFMLGIIDLLHDPAAAIQRFLGRMSVAMFLLLPCLALALALCYWRRRFYVEHLVFALHVQTFAFAAYIPVLLLPDRIWAALFQMAFLFAPTPYFLVAMRRYYGDGWPRTLLKAVVVACLYSLVMTPAMIIAFLAPW